jgi:hypothetical protein
MIVHDDEESEFVRLSFNISNRIRSENEPPFYNAMLHVDGNNQSITGQIFGFIEFLSNFC